MIDSIVILAGGLATRLRPITSTIPKSLLEINGKPFIDYQLELLRKQNITNVIICAGFMGEEIRKYVGDGDKYGLKISYSFDGDKLLGTGGAVKKALNLINGTFYVMYGDSYLNIDFGSINQYFNKFDKSGLMTVYKNDNKWDKSNIIFENGKIVNYDKKVYVPEMKYIDYGLGIFTEKSFTSFRDKEIFDLSDVYTDLLQNDNLIGYEVKERFYEIGSFEGLKETTEFLSGQNKNDGKLYR
jgi:NDP-sugar pyrophosphorylase family protein